MWKKKKKFTYDEGSLLDSVFFSPFKETYINNKETYFIQLYVKLSNEIN